jgi:DNA replication licensing factor MCM2
VGRDARGTPRGTPPCLCRRAPDTLPPHDAAPRLAFPLPPRAPQLTGIDQEKVARLYSDLRKESEISHGVPIAVRHIESIMRISEAIARMRLSNKVTDSDLNIAIKVMLNSFITAQKSAVQSALRRQFSRYLQVEASYNTLLMEKLRELVQERVGVDAALRGSVERFDGVSSVEVRLGDLADKARRHGITDLSSFLSSDILSKAGFAYDRGRKMLVKEL